MSDFVLDRFATTTSTFQVDVVRRLSEGAVLKVLDLLPRQRLGDIHWMRPAQRRARTEQLFVCLTEDIRLMPIRALRLDPIAQTASSFDPDKKLRRVKHKILCANVQAGHDRNGIPHPTDGARKWNERIKEFRSGKYSIKGRPFPTLHPGVDALLEGLYPTIRQTNHS